MREGSQANRVNRLTELPRASQRFIHFLTKPVEVLTCEAGMHPVLLARGTLLFLNVSPSSSQRSLNAFSCNVLLQDFYLGATVTTAYNIEQVY